MTTESPPSKRNQPGLKLPISKLAFLLQDGLKAGNRLGVDGHDEFGRCYSALLPDA
jgi:hypothetical protein